MERELVLVYYGRELSDKSKSFIGVLYTEADLRFDWGALERTLECGLTVRIRPATFVEMNQKVKLLEGMLAEQERRDDPR